LLHATGGDVHAADLQRGHFGELKDPGVRLIGGKVS
jgi:hypothetical protein